MRVIFKKIGQVSLTQWIFIALALGFLIGHFIPNAVPYIRPFRALFLNGVKCIIAPLIISTIVCGIAGVGSFKQLGLIGLRAFIYFEAVSACALVVGLLAVNILKPGAGLRIGHNAAVSSDALASLNFGTFVERLLPTNIIEAIAKGDVLQIVIFATLLGLATLAAGEKGRPVIHFCESLAEIMFRFTGYIMKMAPLGVCAAMAASVSEHGWKVIFPLFSLVGSLYVALIVFVLVVLFPLAHFCNIQFFSFLKYIREALVVAFATTSSESAYPLAINALEKWGAPRRITSFVLPLGYSFNLVGSTLYLALASIFIAQAAGIDMPVHTQVVIILTLMLTSKGVAAVPRATIVVLSGTLTAFNLPVEGIALILAVDEFMDMARSAVNLLGNCLGTAIVTRWDQGFVFKNKKNSGTKPSQSRKDS